MNKHLKDIYGYNNFRPYQKEIIQDILNKKDAMIVFPTGGGKSLCYQFPATYTNKITIVISPLLSLMNDQKLHLTEIGISSLCLNSNTYPFNVSLLSKKNNISDRLKNVNIIYCTPEFITSNISIFTNIIDKICLFAIDEAHCLSEWGHDFRNSYRKLKIIRKEFPRIPIATFTATAIPTVIDDIFETLNLDDVNEYNLSTKRENLSIIIKKKSKNIWDDLNIINPNESTIIYTQTRKQTEQINKILLEYNINSAYFHAGLDINSREKIHKDFSQDKVKVLVATICFGMGIDKSNIRTIINYGAPPNLSTYYQEIGRAGRDGQYSKVILFWSESDFSKNIYLFNNSNNPQYKYNLLNIFKKYIINKNICRQNIIEYYFENGDISDDISNKNKCKKCDNCMYSKNFTELDIYSESQMIINLVNSLDFNYGVNKLVNIIRGSKSSNISYLRENPYYGVGCNNSIDWWKKIIDILVSKDFLKRKLYNYSNVIILGKKELNGDKLLIKVETEQKYSVEKKKSIWAIGIDKLRTKIAYKNKTAPYMLLSDTVMQNIINKKPQNIKELLDVDGINYNFVCNYGEQFLFKKEIRKKRLNNKSNTYNESYDLYKNGHTIKEICKIRSLKSQTIESHIVKILKSIPDKIDKKRIGLTDIVENEISSAINLVGKQKLRPIKNIVGKNISYFQIQIFLIYH